MYDIIVIGAGAAGMTAALYARRNGKTVLVLEAETFGGQISFSPRVENFPTQKALSGSEFADKLLDQIMSLGAEVELEKVTKVEKINDIFHITTDFGQHESKSVIIASGVKPRKIGVAREEELTGKGVSYCAVCDGAFYSGDEVALIGDANTGLQYALLLSSYCKKVYVLTLFDRFFGEAALVDALKTKQNVEIRHNLSLQELLGEEKLSGIVMKDTASGERVEYSVKACFIAIGLLPDNSVFQSLVDLDKSGYIISGENCTTTTEGLFVAGDCRTKRIRQLTTATADGAVAAVNACLFVDKLR